MTERGSALTSRLKIRVLPDEIQNQLLLETLRTYEKACRYVSSYIYEEKKLRIKNIHNELYPILRNEERFAFSSNMAESVIKRVIAEYRTIMDNKEEWRLVEFSHPEYKLVWNRDYALKKDCFSVNTIKGRVKVPYYDKEQMKKYLDGSWLFESAGLVAKHGNWFLHICARKK